MVNFTPQPLYPWEISCATNFTAGCEGPRAGLDGSEEEEKPA